jgi:serine/threonine protein kinase
MMDYAPGGDLHNFIVHGMLDAYGEHADSVIATLMQDVCSAVEWCHQQGVVHNDIKPENFVLTFEKHPRLPGQCVPVAHLTDFGLSFLSDGGNGAWVNTRGLCGSKHYIAPEAYLTHEQPMYGSLTARDVWAAGVVLCNLATSRHLWNHASLYDSNYALYVLDREHALVDMLGIGKRLNQVLVWILNPDANKRPTIKDVRHLLKNTLETIRVRTKKVRLDKIVEEPVVGRTSSLLSMLTFAPESSRQSLVEETKGSVVRREWPLLQWFKARVPWLRA